LASRSAFITRKVFVSGRHQRNIMIRTGGPAPNLVRLSCCTRIQRCLVNFTGTSSSNHGLSSAPEHDRILPQAGFPLRSLAMMDVSSEICFSQDNPPAITATAKTHLVQPRQNATGIVRKVFQSRCGSRSVQSTPKLLHQLNQFFAHQTPWTTHMAMPYNALTARNSDKLRVNPVASSKMMKRKSVKIITHLRP
jgi:hypothetical protein